MAGPVIASTSATVRPEASIAVKTRMSAADYVAQLKGEYDEARSELAGTAAKFSAVG